jgi:hypothetical protein
MRWAGSNYTTPEAYEKHLAFVKNGRMWVGGKYIPTSHPHHRPGRYDSWEDVAQTNYVHTYATPPERVRFEHPQLPRIVEEQKKRYADADSAEARARDGFVYVIFHPLFPDAVKIGKARNPNKRLADANTWCPTGGYELHDAIFDVDAMSLERAVHAAAKARSTQLDGEWFSMNRWHAANLIRKVQRDDSSDRRFGSKQPTA